MFLRSALRAAFQAILFCCFTATPSPTRRSVGVVEAARAPSPVASAPTVPLVEEKRHGADFESPGLNVAQLLVAPRLEDFEPDLVEHPEHFSHAAIYHTYLWLDYIMSVGANLDLAFRKEPQHSHTVAFLSPYFKSNPWLKFSCTSLQTKQKLVDKITALASSAEPSSGVTEEKVAEELANLLLQQIPEISTVEGASENEIPQNLVNSQLKRLILRSGAARDAMSGLRRVEPQRMFSWLDSVRQNSFRTLNNVVAHAFNSALRGFEGIAERELDHPCGVIAAQTQHIMPFSRILPGGILGKIILTGLRVHLAVTNPPMMHIRGVLAFALTSMCKELTASLVRNVFSRLSETRNKAVRSTRLFVRKHFHLRGDIIAQKLLENLMEGPAALMIAQLFQLHSVNIEGITQQGKTVTSALLEGAWAASDGLFIGLKDFAELFYKSFTKYLSFATDLVLLCNGEPGSGETSVEAMDDFLNGRNSTSLTPKERMSVWCRENMAYVKNLEFNMLLTAEDFMNEMVSALKYEFKFFRTHLAKVLTVMYEAAHLMLERGEAASTEATYPRVSRQYSALVKRATSSPPSARERAVARAMFRRPWMLHTLKKLADGLFEACASLSMLENLGNGRFDTTNAQTIAAYSRWYKTLMGGARNIGSSFQSLFGRFLSVQRIVSQLKGPTSYTFLQLLEETPTASESPWVAEAKISQAKFVSTSLFALNLGVTLEPNDLAASSFFNHIRDEDFPATLAFKHWYSWLKRHGAENEADGLQFLECAANINEDGKVRAFMEAMKEALSSRLRFTRCERESLGALRLYDATGRSAIFKPHSLSKMKKHMKSVRPGPLQAPAVFTISQGNTGYLTFSQQPELPIEGTLAYASDFKSQIPIERDPSAIRELLVSQLLPQTGRLPAEMLANVMMVLYERVPSFRKCTFSSFLKQLTPKMLIDATYAVARPLRHVLPNASVYYMKSLYSFPLSLHLLRDILGNAMATALTRLHIVGSTDMAQTAVYGAAYYAYYAIGKRQTGRTAVLCQFQKEMLHVYDRLKYGPISAVFPECEFLVDEGETLEVVTLKCALYRFQKLRSLEITQGGEGCLTPEEAVLYINTAVRHLERARKKTSWRNYLRFEDFRATADEHAMGAGSYTYEKLERGLEEVVAEDQSRDTLGQLTKTELLPSRQTIPSPEGKEKTTNFFRRSFQTIRNAAARVGRYVKKKYCQVIHKFFKIVGHKSVPEQVKIVNTVDAEQFLGALEAGEAEIFKDRNNEAEDLLKAADLRNFGRIKHALEKTSVFLEHPHQMAAIVDQMRALPLVPPENERLFKDIEQRVKKMEKADIEAAAGYLLATRVGKWLGEGPIADALLALHDKNYGKKPVLNQEKVGLLKTFDNVTLESILKSLMLVVAFKQMKARKSDVSAIVGFVPRASISVGGRSGITILPLYREANIKTALQRLTKILDSFQTTELVRKGRTPFCRWLFEKLAAADPQNTYTTRSMFSTKVMGSYKYRWATCALYFLLKDLSIKKQIVTGEELLTHLMYEKRPVLKLLEAYGSTTDPSHQLDLQYTGGLGDLISLVHAATMGASGREVLQEYDSRTGNVKLKDTQRKSIMAHSFYDTCREAFLYATSHAKNFPSDAEIKFRSKPFQNWLRFIKENVLKIYADDYLKDGHFRNIPVKRLRTLSSVYSTGELVDYMLSLPQNSFHPPAKVAREAAKRLLVEGKRDLNSFGLALTLLDLEKHAAKAQLEAYRTILTTVPVYKDKNRLSLHERQLEIAEEHMLKEDAVGTSLDALSAEEANTILEALDSELSRTAEKLWTEVNESGLTMANIQRRAADYVCRSDVSLLDGECLNENLERAILLLDGIAQKKKWAEVLTTLTVPRNGGAVSPSQATRVVRTLADSVWPFNTYSYAIDLLYYVLTEKAGTPLRSYFLPLARLKAWWHRVKLDFAPDEGYNQAATRARAQLATRWDPPVGGDTSNVLP